MNIDYKKQAEDFLSITDTTFKIERAEPQKVPLWAKDGKYGINYIVTLENKNAKYTFDFWDSIRDREIAEKILDNAKIDYRGISYSKEKKEKLLQEYTPTAYDILACLSPLYEDNFKDFCSAYGYDEDSITALKTFEAVKEQDRNIRKLWDRSEIEKLIEIQ